MKQYAITGKIYSEAGALTNEGIRREYDSPFDAEKKYNEMKKERQASGNLQYGEVELHVLAEKKIDNPSTFFEQFHA